MLTVPASCAGQRLDRALAELLPEHSREVARSYGVRFWPALVYLRGGEFLGTIEGLRDWSDFLARSQALLAGPAQPLPPKVIPVAAGGTPSCA